MIFTIRKEIVGFLFIYFFHLFALNAQSTEEKITKIAADYFELTRENFHIQFNKINRFKTIATNILIWTILMKCV